MNRLQSGPFVIALQRGMSTLLVAVTLVVLVPGTPAQAQQTALAERIPLNSERIEARFGSYSIEVLRSDSTVRVSSLYSTTNGRSTTRTFAVVLYPERVQDDFAKEHEAILAGGSIGAVFAAHGWQVNKHNRLYDLVRATPKLVSLMALEQERQLAVHIYLLEITKPGLSIEYAAIAEIHHPDYLDIRDLERIYGDIPDLSPSQLAGARELLKVARAIMRE